MSKTEKQIIQALKICKLDTTCVTCPYYGKSKAESCFSRLSADALSIIHKQKKQINELTGKHYNECGQIARYSDELNQFADIGKMYSEIKAEIIKEFAEKLKNLIYPQLGTTYEKGEAFHFCLDEIDNLVEEMTGGEDNAD